MSSETGSCAVMDAATVEQWLQKISGWTSTSPVSTGLPSPSDLDQLGEFLHQLHQWLHECGRPEVALRSVPKVDQLLGRLCRIEALRLQESVYRQVSQCVLELRTNQPSKPLEEKVNTRVETRIRRSVTSYQVPHPCQGTCTAGTLSYPVNRYNRRASLKLLESMVDDLKALQETRWDANNNCLVPCPQLSNATINNLSELCLPLVTSGESAVAPLVESLLGYHGNGTTDGLSPRFLQAVMATQDDAYTDGQCSLELSYEGRVSLWSRHLAALQSEFLHLVDALSRDETLPSTAVCKQLMTSRGLPRACAENPALLSAAEGLMEALLQGSQGSGQALALLQQFAGCIRERQSWLALPHHRGCELAHLHLLLQPDPRELPLESVCLHINSICICLSRIATATPTRLSCAWLLLMQFEVWYPVVVQLLLLGKAEDVPACLNVVAFYNMPTATGKHEGFKAELGEVLTSLQGLRSVSDLRPRDLHEALGRHLGRGCQDDLLSGVVQPLLRLFAFHGKAAHQIQDDIVRLASGGNQPNATDTLAFFLDCIEFSLSAAFPRVFREKTQQDASVGDRGKELVNTLHLCRASYAEYQQGRSDGAGFRIDGDSCGSLLDRCGRVLRLIVPLTR